MTTKELIKATEKEQQILDKFEECQGNVTQTAKQLKVKRSYVQRVLRKFNINSDPLMDGSLNTVIPIEFELPKENEKKVYLLSSCQNNTKVFKKFFKNLEVFKKYKNATLLISRFVYNKAAYGSNSVKPDTTLESDIDEMWYDESLKDYFFDEAVKLAPDLIFWGNFDSYPTNTNPLGSLNAFGGYRSGIYPHVKFAMKSLPVIANEKKGELSYKLNFTTGGCTQLNYIQKRTGIKAEFYHCIGALIVEVNSDGEWFVRQINADTEGNFYDLDILVKNGKIYKSKNSIIAINPGDIHASEIDEDIFNLLWGKNGFIDTYKPKFQFLHDLFSMRSRSHHENKSFLKNYEKYVDGIDSVEKEIEITADFCKKAYRSFCKTIVVRSNHDLHLEKWLDEENFKGDLKNSNFYLKAMTAKIEAMEKGDKDFKVLEWALRKYNIPDDILFLNQEDSFRICETPKHDGIECGQHGHNGPNGARGSSNNLKNLGRRINFGHTHSAEINDGAYVAGTCSKLRLGFNTGPSSWSHSFIITYKNGKRAIITPRNNKWKA